MIEGKHNDETKIPEMLTIPELSKRTGFSYGVLNRMAKRGGFATIKAGRRTYVNLESFLRYLNNGETRAEEVKHG